MITNLNGCFECSKNEQNDMQYKSNEITKTKKKNEGIIYLLSAFPIVW